MREVVLDTETTGLNVKTGDRLVEIGCVEIVNLLRTKNTFWAYINPERDVPAEAVKIHGLTNEFLKDKALFAQVMDQFLEFIGDAPLVIHNASFDMSFINYQLGLEGRPPIANTRIIDTLAIARKTFPNAPASLDALCKRFQIDNSSRQLHGALLDAELLSDVYLELRGGRQTTLELKDQDVDYDLGNIGDGPHMAVAGAAKPARKFLPSDQEQKAHAAFITQINDPVWLRQRSKG